MSHIYLQYLQSFLIYIQVPDIVKAQYRNPPAVVVPDHPLGRVNQPLEPHMKPLVLPTNEEKEQVYL